jgi:hypothetical protein
VNLRTKTACSKLPLDNGVALFLGRDTCGGQSDWSRPRQGLPFKRHDHSVKILAASQEVIVHLGFPLLMLQVVVELANQENYVR